jgi:hypothetical protein
MTRRRLFNIAAVASLALCLATAYAWHHALNTYIPEKDGIEQRGYEINQLVNHEAWGTPGYRRRLAEYNAWRLVRDDYRQREPAVLATYHLRYIVLPRLAVIALAILPVVWIFLFWRRWEHRWRVRQAWPPTRRERIHRRVFTISAALCFLLSLGTAAIWVRSDWMSDSFILSKFFDEGEYTFWKQSSLMVGRGRIGYNSIGQSGQRGKYRADMERVYIRNFHQSLAALPFHSAGPASDVDFRFGPDHRMAGFIWSYFEHGQAGHRPRSYGYELIVPLLGIEVLSLIIPTLWIWRRFKRSRIVRLGLCRKCQYDLTGNSSGVCPECGTAIIGHAMVR